MVLIDESLKEYISSVFQKQTKKGNVPIELTVVFAVIIGDQQAHAAPRR